MPNAYRSTDASRTAVRASRQPSYSPSCSAAKNRPASGSRSVASASNGSPSVTADWPTKASMQPRASRNGRADPSIASAAS